jgi:peptidoglycan/LPS O-acetylase OafA/YrhL
MAGVGLCVASESWVPVALQSFCEFATGALYPPQETYLVQKTFGAILICAGVTQFGALRRMLSHPRVAAFSKYSFPLYLVHWPILFGPGAALVLATHGTIGVLGLRLLAIAFCIAASLLAAWAFAPIDRAAVRLSRAIRFWRPWMLPISVASARR